MNRDKVIAMIEERSKTAQQCIEMNEGKPYTFELNDWDRNEDGTWTGVKVIVLADIPNHESKSAETVYTVPLHVGENIEVPAGSKVTYYDPEKGSSCHLGN